MAARPTKAGHKSKPATQPAPGKQKGRHPPRKGQVPAGNTKT
ncbi:hypothetical protein ARZXY2_585 [Arthrobacter sp. ZXY-2]|nr:hypothetical protein ARZXY2_585 [Arthrobacter sp. ZXY-2]